MIYEFKSKAAGQLILLGSSGDQLLRLIGREPSAKGIIEAPAMPAAIEAIETAIAQEDAQRSRAEEERLAEGRKAPHGDGVTLRQRAWPFVELMKRTHDQGEAIVWGV
jgi:hypothetical protein